MIECDNNEEFIIANLSSTVFNETLDLAFNEGEKICFKVDGPGTVHLTGNLMDEDNMPPTGEGFDMLAGSDSEMESEEEEAGERIQEVIEKSGKRKKVEEVKNQEVAAKKAKVDVDDSEAEGTTDADTTANATTGDDDDDDSDDSDDEEDSEEEEDPKEIEGAKPKQTKKEGESKAEAAKEDNEDEDSDDDSDDEDDSDDKEEEEAKAV